MQIPLSLRESLSQAIDEAASEYVFLADTTPPELGGPFILYMNEAMLRAFGYEAAEVIGKSPNMFWGPETDVAVLAELRRNIAQMDDSSGEFAAYRKDGSMMWVRFRGRVYVQDGVPVHWIAIGSDVTESRRRVAEIQELSQFRSDLIAMLAHDFRGPLTAVSGFADLLLEAGSDDLDADDREEMLKTIRREAQRLANFAADTLTVSRMESEELSILPERFDFVQMLREIADIYQGRGVIALHAPAALEVDADRGRMRQVADNLISNAVKYSPAESPVVVEASVSGGEAVLTVRDAGIGIPADELDRVFERYTRASNARANGIPGTGFGLYLAEAIVRHHGGSISVSSTVGAGSTFEVRIPQFRGAERYTDKTSEVRVPSHDARSVLSAT